MCKSYNFDIYISGIPVFFDEFSADSQLSSRKRKTRRYNDDNVSDLRRNKRKDREAEIECAGPAGFWRKYINFS